MMLHHIAKDLSPAHLSLAVPEFLTAKMQSLITCQKFVPYTDMHIIMKISAAAKKQWNKGRQIHIIYDTLEILLHRMYILVVLAF